MATKVCMLTLLVVVSVVTIITLRIYNDSSLTDYRTVTLRRPTRSIKSLLAKLHPTDAKDSSDQAERTDKDDSKVEADDKEKNQEISSKSEITSKKEKGDADKTMEEGSKSKATEKGEQKKTQKEKISDTVHHKKVDADKKPEESDDKRKTGSKNSGLISKAKDKVKLTLSSEPTVSPSTYTEQPKEEQSKEKGKVPDVKTTLSGASDAPKPTNSATSSASESKGIFSKLKNKVSDIKDKVLKDDATASTLAANADSSKELQSNTPASERGGLVSKLKSKAKGIKDKVLKDGKTTTSPTVLTKTDENSSLSSTPTPDNASQVEATQKGSSKPNKTKKKRKPPKKGKKTTNTATTVNKAGKLDANPGVSTVVSSVATDRPLVPQTTMSTTNPSSVKDNRIFSKLKEKLKKGRKHKKRKGGRRNKKKEKGSTKPILTETSSPAPTKTSSKNVSRNTTVGTETTVTNQPNFAPSAAAQKAPENIQKSSSTAQACVSGEEKSTLIFFKYFSVTVTILLALSLIIGIIVITFCDCCTCKPGTNCCKKGNKTKKVFSPQRWWHREATSYHEIPGEDEEAMISHKTEKDHASTGARPKSYASTSKKAEPPRPGHSDVESFKSVKDMSSKEHKKYNRLDVPKEKGKKDTKQKHKTKK